MSCSNGNIGISGNVYLAGSRKINVAGQFTNSTPISVKMANGTGTFTNSSNTAYNDASKFVSGNNSYFAGTDASGQLKLYTPYTVTWNNYNGATLETDTNIIIFISRRFQFVFSVFFFAVSMLLPKTKNL